jgi:phenylacetate-CoA ligase
MVGSRFLSVFTPIEKQVEWLARLDPLYLYTFPSNLDGLLTVLGDARGMLPSLRRIYCGAEVVDPALRERARTALGVEIAENYGSTEAFVAWECRDGRLHVNAEHVLVEIVDEAGRSAEPGVLGRMLVTTLQNSVMPLVRYEIGDWGALAGGRCPCGRTLPLLERVAGRAVSLFRTATGRIVTPWDIVVRIKYRNDVRQYQIVQKTLERCVMRYVAPVELGATARAEIASHVGAVLGGGVRTDFERVASIERGPTGKYLTAISEVVEAVPA